MEDTGSINSLKTSADFQNLEKTSSLTSSPSEIPNPEIFAINNPSISELNYIQPPNGCSNFEDANFIVGDKMSKNYSAVSSVAHLGLNGSSETCTYIQNESGQLSYKRKINTFTVDLTGNDGTPSSVDNLGYAGQMEVPHVSSGLIGNRDFSYELLQSQDICHPQSAFELNLVDIPDISSSHCMGVSNSLPVSSPPLGSKLAPCPQLYSSVCPPIKQHYMSNQESQNIINTNVTQRDRSQSAPMASFATSQHSPVCPGEFYISNKFTLPNYESNGHYNMDSTYASPKSYLPNFGSNGIESDVNFPVLNVSPLQVNNTNIDLAPYCSANFGTFHAAPSKGNTSVVQNEQSMNTIQKFHSDSNGFDARKGMSLSMNGHNHIKVQKHLNPYNTSSKKMRMGNVCDNEYGHIYNWFNANGGDLCSEINVINEVNNLSQDIQTSSHVKELYPTTNGADVVPFNGDLYNELGTFFN